MTEIDLTRRNLIKSAGALSLITPVSNVYSKSLLEPSSTLYSAKRGIYLNTGTTGVMPANVLSALDQGYKEYASTPTFASTESPFLGAWQINNRKVLGRFLKTNYKNLVLTNNTTMGLHLALNGLDLSEGDEILTTNHEHLALDSPLWVLAKRYGVKIKVIYIPSSIDTPQEIVALFKDALTPKTKLACFSHITWTTGLQLPVSEICALLRSNNILTLVDGAHALGMITTEMDKIDPDFYSASGHKWLNGPPGTGFLFINPKVQNFWSTLSEFEHIRAHVSSISLTDSMQVRGQVNTPAIGGMIEALDYYQKNIPESVEVKILKLSNHLRKAITTVWGKDSLLSPGAVSSPEMKSGIVSFIPSKNKDDAYNQDLVESINNRLKSDFNIWGRTVKYYKSESDKKLRKRTHALRLCTHYNNSVKEVDLAMKAIVSMST